MEYHKLVRDNVPEIIKKNGGSPVFHVAELDEYAAKLQEKLSEEVQEYFEKPNLENLADIIEVSYALGLLLQTPAQQIEEIRQKKRQERGGFAKGIILDEA
jgi:predicted house-cleaning noncanonical NTP pyrophosphatase (MazG superfamily)